MKKFYHYFQLSQKIYSKLLDRTYSLSHSSKSLPQKLIINFYLFSILEHLIFIILYHLRCDHAIEEISPSQLIQFNSFRKLVASYHDDIAKQLKINIKQDDDYHPVLKKQLHNKMETISEKGSCGGQIVPWLNPFLFSLSQSNAQNQASFRSKMNELTQKNLIINQYLLQSLQINIKLINQINQLKIIHQKIIIPKVEPKPCPVSKPCPSCPKVEPKPCPVAKPCPESKVITKVVTQPCPKVVESKACPTCPVCMEDVIDLSPLERALYQLDSSAMENRKEVQNIINSSERLETTLETEKNSAYVPEGFPLNNPVQNISPAKPAMNIPDL